MGGSTDLQLLGRAVRASRVLRGWTQVELAARAGIHRTSVGRVERADDGTTVVTLLRLVRVLDLGLDQVLGLTGNRAGSAGRTGICPAGQCRCLVAATSSRPSP